MRHDAPHEEKLQYTIKYAYENSPYYKELLDDHDIDPEDIQTTDDLSKLPVTTGEDIIQNQPPNTREFRFATDADTRRPVQSTGTRGTPKTVLLSPDDWEIYRRQTVTALQDAFGITEDDTVATYLPHIGFNVSGPILSDSFKHIGATEIPFATTPYPPHVEVKLLKQYRPNVMAIAASGAYRKGKKFQNNDIDPAELGIGKIVISGEPISVARKQAIEQMFDADVYEMYAASESSISAYECVDDPAVMHSIDEYGHIEILDENNDPVEPGGWGRIVFTRLLPPGAESKMPIIRYALGDRAQRLKHPDCTCGTNPAVSFGPPSRESHRVSVGPADLNHKEFAAFLYNDDYYGDRVGESLLEVDYDDETGKHVLTFRFETLDPGLETGEETSITPSEDPSNEIRAFGQRVLDYMQNLRGYVEQQDYIQFNVSVVDEIEQPPGKPVRVVRNQS